MKKLLVGSGVMPLAGYITLDADPKHKPDFLAAVPPYPQEIIDAGPFGEIMALHFFEHLYPTDAVTFLLETYQLLMNGGKIILEMPNLEYCCKVLLGLEKPKSPQLTVPAASIEAIYGNGYDYGDFNAHRWGWTPLSLERKARELFPTAAVNTGRAQYHFPERDFRITIIKQE